MNMVVVGSIALDTIKTFRETRERILGGSATFFSTVASFFTKVGMVGVAGRDFDNKHIAFLRERGIDMSGFEQVEGKTFHWAGGYGEDFGDATTHTTELNVFETFDPKLPESYKNAPFLFLANIHPALQKKVIEIVNKPRLIALDTMNFWITNPQTHSILISILPHIDVLFVNRQEAALLSGERTLARAVRKLLEMGPKRLVVKLGELGAMTASKDGWFFAPAFPCAEIVDPTGAGDSFGGGFMGALAEKGDLSPASYRKAMLYGSAMGSITVEDFSIDSYRTMTRGHIDDRFAKIMEMTKVA
ncbi:MAG: sugar kinase [Candidatus Riflebacteria bacterium]|nr:sugar kinase [Candidatus Riflebacteria bacterium]